MEQNITPMQTILAGVTTEHIQQTLDENKQLTLAILEKFTSGKVAETIEMELKLQRNLTFLAAIADTQTHIMSMSRNATMQSAPQHSQQEQQMNTPPSMVPQSPMLSQSALLFQPLRPPQESPVMLSPPSQQQRYMYENLMTGYGAGMGFNMLYGDRGQASSSGGGPSGEGSSKPPLNPK